MSEKKSQKLQALSSIKELEIHEENHILFVALNRPSKHNALSLKMIQELTRLFDKLNQKAEEFQDLPLRAVLLYGKGKSFCSGGDLNWLQLEEDSNFHQNRKEAYDLFLLFSSLSQCRLPLMAWLKGYVMGGGLCLASVCDFAFAETGTRFAFSEVKRGLVPAVIASFVLQKMPLAEVRRLMLTAEVFDVSKALSLHLIQDFGSPKEVKEKIQNCLSHLYQNSPQSIEKTKTLLRRVGGKKPSEVQSMVCDFLAKARLSSEAKEGLSSFLQKKTPSWHRNFSGFSKP